MPTLLSWVSSLVGIVMLVASDFGFVRNYVFKPLLCCILVTYFYGCFTLPVLLQFLGSLLPAYDDSDGDSGTDILAKASPVPRQQQENPVPGGLQPGEVELEMTPGAAAKLAATNWPQQEAGQSAPMP